MRGAVLSHFGWSYDYLLWGISWRNVTLMMADAPGYDYERKKEKKIPKGKDLKSKLESIGWDFSQIK